MSETRLITVGKIGSVYGVKGWLRINSFTSPPQQIETYLPWRLLTRRGVEAVEIEAIKPHGDKLVAKFKHYDDPESAQRLVQSDIQVDANLLPQLPVGEYYWHQLQNLKVLCEFEGKQTNIGRVDRLLETGANDVLVVKGSKDSIDKRERLIPYIRDEVIKLIDLENSKMVVNWDPEF